MSLHPTPLVCVGGPFDGEALVANRRPDDTYEVYQLTENKALRPSNVRGRTRAIWASDLPYTFAPAGTRLGHYRIDLRGGQATWVPA